MPTGLGKYFKTRQYTLFARVGLEITPMSDGQVGIEFAPSALENINAQSPGWVAWLRALEKGVRLGARTAKCDSAQIRILSIVVNHSDTTEGSLFGAGALAVWDAVGFVPEPGVREELDRIVWEPQTTTQS